ncbi:phage holin [Bacillus sp. FSL K6-3431]|uniref:phage holin n=1 Tax=Bacillus sp. FSL K6-3431 TaxID=2921500 RepID=UPI0030F94406
MNTAVLIRTIVLAVALLNQTLVLAGYSPLPWGDAEVESVMTGVFTFGAALWTWWKNNSVTKEAQKADEYLRDLKTKGDE